MKSTFRYNQRRNAPRRPARGYGRWLAFWLRAGASALRLGRPRRRLLWTADGSADLLAAGFPSLLAVPEPLFAASAALFPDRLRLRAEGSEEELLAQLRRIEKSGGARFDWDAFLAACERRNRRAGRVEALCAAISALAPARVDARTPQTALHSIFGKETNEI